MAGFLWHVALKSFPILSGLTETERSSGNASPVIAGAAGQVFQNTGSHSVIAAVAEDRRR